MRCTVNELSCLVLLSSHGKWVEWMKRWQVMCSACMEFTSEKGISDMRVLIVQAM